MLGYGMVISERRAREQAERRRLIISTARRLAEAEGWEAVTTRRLSEEIEYSQPVLYKHFAGMDRIAEAVAIDGFAELAETLSRARRGRRPLPPHLRKKRRPHSLFLRRTGARRDRLHGRLLHTPDLGKSQRTKQGLALCPLHRHRNRQIREQTHQ